MERGEAEDALRSLSHEVRTMRMDFWADMVDGWGRMWMGGVSEWVGGDGGWKEQWPVRRISPFECRKGKGSLHDCGTSSTVVVSAFSQPGLEWRASSAPGGGGRRRTHVVGRGGPIAGCAGRGPRPRAEANTRTSSHETAVVGIRPLFSPIVRHLLSRGWIRTAPQGLVSGLVSKRGRRSYVRRYSSRAAATDGELTTLMFWLASSSRTNRGRRSATRHTLRPTSRLLRTWPAVCWPAAQERESANAAAGELASRALLLLNPSASACRLWLRSLHRI